MKKSLCALVFAVVVLVTISIAGAGEPYRQVNRAELPFIFSGAMKSLEVDAAGNTVNVEGVVKEFSLDGKKIELETDKLTKIGSEVFILTKGYGKVKVTFDSNAGVTLWLTASQTKQFKELRRGVSKPKKRFEDMTAMEVAQDPAAYGFEKGGSMETNPTEAGLRAGMKPSRDDQWTKKTSDGKLYILTIHYEDGKLVSAKWGGF